MAFDIDDLSFLCLHSLLNLYTTNHTPACIYVYGKSLDIVVACEEEIQKADLLKLKKEINCSIYTHNGEPCFIKNKILIIN